MGRILIGLLFVVGYLIGQPYAALPIGYMLGNYTFVMPDAAGQQRTLVIGPSAPRPDWLPTLPRSILLKASMWTPAPHDPVSGDVEVITHKSVADVAQFYQAALTEAGFEMRDAGTGPLDPATAYLLGLEKFLYGRRTGDDLSIKVEIDSPSGLLLRPRLVKLSWGRWAEPRLAKAADAPAGR